MSPAACGRAERGGGGDGELGREYMWVETEKIDGILNAENSESRTEKEGERNLAFECLPHGSIYTQEQGDNNHRIRVQSMVTRHVGGLGAVETGLSGLSVR